MSGLQRAANIAIIVAATVVSGGMLYRMFLPNKDASGMISTTPELKGRLLPLQARNIGAHATAVLFVKPGCHYCSESMPFYQRLAALRASAPNDLKIVAAIGNSSGGGQDVKDYFAQHGVVPDGLEPIDFATLGVRAVPTLILLDHESRVAGVWTGLLPVEKENAVLTALKLVCAKCAG